MLRATHYAKRIHEVAGKSGLMGLAKKTLSFGTERILERIQFPQLTEEIATLPEGESPDTLIEFAFNRYNGLIRPLQKKPEAKKLMEYLRQNQPRIVVEIGTAKGGNLFLIAQSAHPEAQIFSVDLEWGQFGGGYPKWKSRYFQQLGRPKQKIQLVRGDSHAPETLHQLKERLNGQLVDFLFIDGDHTYEGVKQDYQMYSALVRPRGAVGLHDIVFHPRAPDCQVDRFWKELQSEQAQTEEWIATPQQDKMGIGMVYL